MLQDSKAFSGFSVDDIENAKLLAVSLTRNAGPMNMFGQCGFSMPVQPGNARLPVGLQISCPPFSEDRVLAIALALEGVLGIPRSPDVSAFADDRVGTGLTC